MVVGTPTSKKSGDVPWTYHGRNQSRAPDPGTLPREDRPTDLPVESNFQEDRPTSPNIELSVRRCPTTVTTQKSGICHMVKSVKSAIGCCLGNLLLGEISDFHQIVQNRIFGKRVDISKTEDIREKGDIPKKWIFAEIGENRKSGYS